jgi:hypothetical protein
VNIRSGPGAGFAVVDRLVPGQRRPALLQTNLGFVYLGIGWVDASVVTLEPARPCATLPVISASDSSPGAVCRIRADQQSADIRVDPDATSERAYLATTGTTLTVFRVKIGADGQPWYYAATNDALWRFGWVPASQVSEVEACPAPEPGPNLVLNGDFSAGDAEWLPWGANYAVVDGVAHLEGIESPGGVLFQPHAVPLPAGATILISVDVGNTGARDKSVSIRVHSGPPDDWTGEIFIESFLVPAGAGLQTRTFSRTLTVDWESFTFDLWIQDVIGDPDLLIDNISVQQASIPAP